MQGNFTQTLGHNMLEYFKTLHAADPVFRGIVESRLRELEQREDWTGLTVNDLTEEDELDILRVYCVILHNDYETLKRTLLQSLEISARSVRLKPNTN
jgi:hypothetical protein